MNKVENLITDIIKIDGNIIRYNLLPNQTIINSGNSDLRIFRNQSDRTYTVFSPQSSFINTTDSIKLVFLKSLVGTGEITIITGSFRSDKIQLSDGVLVADEIGRLTTNVLAFGTVATKTITTGKKGYVKTISIVTDNKNYTKININITDGVIVHTILTDDFISSLWEKDFSVLNDGKGLSVNPGAVILVEGATNDIAQTCVIDAYLEIYEV